MEEDGFWALVDRRGPDECWPWMGKIETNGYGKWHVGGESRLAHRVAHELAVGLIPDGLTIDHVKARGCTRRDCCNPAHLEAVTLGENVLRGDGPTAVNARKTHCVRGHKFTPENTYRNPKGWRKCRTCKRANDQERRLAHA